MENVNALLATDVVAITSNGWLSTSQTYRDVQRPNNKLFASVNGLYFSQILFCNLLSYITYIGRVFENITC